jgi:PmbA protein
MRYKKMDNKLKELAEWTLKTVQAEGAQAAKVSVYSDRFVEIDYREKKPENIKEASTKDMGINFYVDGRFSNQSTSDLRKDALKEFIKNAVKMTRLLAEDTERTLPDKEYYEKLEDINLEKYDPAIVNMTPDEKHKMVKIAEEACLAKGGNKVISVSAGFYDSTSEGLIMDTNGFLGTSQNTTMYVSASMTGKDEGDRKPEGSDYDLVNKKSKMIDPAKVGENAAKRTFELFGAKKIQSEKLPIIIENRVSGRLMSMFFQGLYGSGLWQKTSFLLDKKGEQIASNKFTLIDDPYIIGGFGSKLFDGDSLKAKKRTIFEDGVLKEYFIDWYYSRKLKCEPTTGSNSNLILPVGTKSIPELMKDLKRGVLITGFIGGNSNSTTGDFSVGIIGSLFDNGEPVQAISEMNIAGNHLTFWKQLVELGNDPNPYSSYIFPSLVIDDVMVSGL